MGDFICLFYLILAISYLRPTEPSHRAMSWLKSASHVFSEACSLGGIPIDPLRALGTIRDTANFFFFFWCSYEQCWNFVKHIEHNNFMCKVASILDS